MGPTLARHCLRGRPRRRREQIMLPAPPVAPGPLPPPGGGADAAAATGSSLPRVYQVMPAAVHLAAKGPVQTSALVTKPSVTGLATLALVIDCGCRRIDLTSRLPV